MATTQEYVTAFMNTLPWIVFIMLLPRLIKAIVEAVKEVKA